MQTDSQTKKNPKTAKTVIKVIAIAAAAVLALTLVTDLIVVFSVSPRVSTLESFEADKEYDCIIVLGCAVYKDGDPSPFLKDRLSTAVSLYKAGVSDKLLLSGDRNDAEEYDEVGAMYDYCIANGVDPEDIFLDIYGYSTYETMYRAYYYYGVRSAVVVTQGYHIYRSLFIANGLGIDAEGVKAINSGYIVAPHNYVREYAAMVKDCVQTMIKPATDEIGNVYDISGSGEVTRTDYY